VSASSAELQHQGIDAAFEQLNRKLKHEPRLSDANEHWDIALRVLHHYGGLRDALNARLGLRTRARRRRSAAPMAGKHVRAFMRVLRSGKVFQPQGRTQWQDAGKKPLASGAASVLEEGKQRANIFIQQRLVQRTVPLTATRKREDTARLPLSSAEAAKAEKKESKGKPAAAADGDEEMAAETDSDSDSEDSEAAERERQRQKDRRRRAKAKREAARSRGSASSRKEAKNTSRRDSKDGKGEKDKVMYDPDSEPESGAAANQQQPAGGRPKRQHAQKARELIQLQSATEESSSSSSESDSE
jgi:hypothetical protein